MVVQPESGEMPSDAPVRRSERARYVLVKNHVRELRASDDAQPEPRTLAPDDQTHKRPRKSFSDSPDSEETRDLDELRRVYYKCKRLLRTIAHKYGDRLDLHADDVDLHVDDDPHAEHVCSCRTNRKIKFDESGSRVRVECGGCRVQVASGDGAEGRCRVQIESGDAGLPDDAAGLDAVLRQPALDAGARRAAVDRLRTVRATHADELRYHRRTLLERMRSRPDDELGFVGTNLSSLPGYHYSNTNS